MLKRADKWNWGNTILFVFSMITSTGYLVKHLMMIIFGVKARRLLKQKNDPFDQEVQKFWFLHRHAQVNRCFNGTLFPFEVSLHYQEIG